MYPPFTAPLILKAVGAHMTRVFGEEAAAVELHACGVVRVMLWLWCVDGPHSGSVLTLPVFQLIVQSAEWLDNPAVSC